MVEHCFTFHIPWHTILCPAFDVLVGHLFGSASMPYSTVIFQLTMTETKVCVSYARRHQTPCPTFHMPDISGIINTLDL